MLVVFVVAGFVLIVLDIALYIRSGWVYLCGLACICYLFVNVACFGVAGCGGVFGVWNCCLIVRFGDFDTCALFAMIWYCLV